MISKTVRFECVILLTIAQVACSSAPTATLTLMPLTETLVPPSPTLLPTATATFTALPTSTTPPTLIPTATLTLTPTATLDVKVSQSSEMVTYDNVKLRFFLLPGWQVKGNDNTSLQLVLPDSDGRVLASVSIVYMGAGPKADKLPDNTPQVAAYSATTMCNMGILPFRATFKEDRMVKFANGIQVPSAYATATPPGSKFIQEFWFINFMTENQYDILLFVGPVGFYEMNMDIMEAYLSTIEAAAK